MNCDKCEKIDKIIETLQSASLTDYECCIKIAKIVGIYDYADDVSAIKLCKSELDHDWECISIGTDGCTYVCTKCNAHEIRPA